MLRETVRKNRKNATIAENLFWQEVRNKKINGKKFVRQFAIVFSLNNQSRFFVADFYCHEKKLVIEIDGKIHDGQKDYDELRDYIINQLGIKVIRFTNEQIENDLTKTIEEIKKILE